MLLLALCVNEFTHINIVDFFITRSITSNKFALSSLNQEIRLLAIFNLVQFSYIHSVVLNLNFSIVFYFKSFYTCFLSLKKHQKRPAPAKSVITAFCSRVASDIPRSAVICRKQLFVQASGTKQLAFHAITASRICTAQTNFVLFPMLARLFAVILMVPVLKYYNFTL